MSQKKVLSFAPFGSYLVHNQLDAIVGTALRLRDCEVAVVRCDGIYKHCDVLINHTGDKENFCDQCTQMGKNFFGAFSLPTFELRNYLEQSDWIEAERWVDTLRHTTYPTAQFEDLSIGDWVISSVFSSFRITHDGLHDPQVIAVHRQYLINGLLTYRALDRIVSEFSPTSMIVFNGRFAPYRIALEFGKKQGIPVVTHERGYADDTFFLFQNKSAIQTQPTYDCYQAWQDIPLNREELERVHRYYSNREGGTDLNYTPFVSYKTEYHQVRQLLRIPADKRVFVVFTSSEYELAYCEDLKTPFSQLEVIERLIDIFRSRDDCLVIRHHPYLAGNEGSAPDRGFISRALALSRSLPPNVRMIMPSEELSSYALFWLADAAISFFSSTGLEAVARGVPTASFQQSRFKDGTICHITDFSTDSLKELVDKLFEYNFGIHDLQKLYRFQYSVIGRLSTPFKSFGIRNHFEQDIRFTSVEELLPGNDPALDRLCNNLISGEPLLTVPGEKDHAQSTDDEKEFFRAEIKQIQSIRSEIPQKAKQYMNARKRSQIVLLPVVTTEGKEPDISWWLSFSREQSVRALSPLLAIKTPVGELLKSIYDLVSQAPEEFFVVNDSRITYTEAFLSTCIDTLLDDTTTKTIGVRVGGWILDSQEKIVEGFFSKRNPHPTCKDTSSSFSLLDTPALLSLCLFRRSSLIDILEKLMKIADDEHRCMEALLEVLTGQTVTTTYSQAALLSGVKYVDQSTLERVAL